MQHVVAFRLLRVVLDSRVQMLQLVVAELPDGVDQLLDLAALEQLGAVLAHVQQHPQLVVVVVADLGLDSLGARHRHLGPQQGGANAERIPGDVPQRPQSGWSYAVLGDQAVEGLEVVHFLVPHVADQGLQLRVGFEDGVLALVDQVCTELAGLVDAQLDAALAASEGVQRGTAAAASGGRDPTAASRNSSSLGVRGRALVAVPSFAVVVVVVVVGVVVVMVTVKLRRAAEAIGRDAAATTCQRLRGRVREAMRWAMAAETATSSRVCLLLLLVCLVNGEGKSGSGCEGE